jgi:mono/diheme cytochrome c family protein
VTLASTSCRWVLAACLSGLSLTTLAAQPQEISPGQRYYEKICSKCHEAGIGPVLKGRGLAPETVVAFARIGVNAMPAFRVTDIDDATLYDLGVFLSKSQPLAAPKQ